MTRRDERMPHEHIPDLDPMDALRTQAKGEETPRVTQPQEPEYEAGADYMPHHMP